MVDKETMEEHYMCMETRKGQRHVKTLERHLSKFNRLCQAITGGHSNSQHGKHDINGCINTYTCMNTATTFTSTSEQRDLRGSNTSTSTSNTSNNSNNWVRNFSKTPLTDGQQCLLSCGPNFVIVPRDPPTVST